MTQDLRGWFSLRLRTKKVRSLPNVAYKVYGFNTNTATVRTIAKRPTKYFELRSGYATRDCSRHLNEQAALPIGHGKHLSAIYFVNSPLATAQCVLPASSMSATHSDTDGKLRMEFFKCPYSAPLPLITHPSTGAPYLPTRLVAVVVGCQQIHPRTTSCSFTDAQLQFNVYLIFTRASFYQHNLGHKVFFLFGFAQPRHRARSDRYGALCFGVRLARWSPKSADDKPESKRHPLDESPRR